MSHANRTPRAQAPRPTARPRWRAGGFTLIELLVVVAVIAILASMTMPVVLRTMRLSQKTTCQSNHMQLGHALKTYGVTFETYLPPFGYWVIGDSPPWYEPFWSCNLADFLYPHLSYEERLEKAISCPLWTPPGSWYARGITCSFGEVFCYVADKYSYRAVGYGSMKLPAIHRPSYTILLTDGQCGYAYTPEVWPREKDLDGDGIPDTGNNTSSIYGGGAPFRHDGTSNILCADGHVESIPAREWLTNNKRWDPDP
jgi:prepilin-type N-terminal cleavage/methylation domain-containing protein/prepilin-type processing-associated H-X9-DG protein